MGGRGNDIVVGGIGSDSLLGQQGNDFMFDEVRIDEEVFATSKDVYSGGAGNDVIAVANGTAEEDKVSCGTGFDRVFADRNDAVAPDCERVADTPTEYRELSIPLSFILDLHPDAFQ